MSDDRVVEKRADSDRKSQSRRPYEKPSVAWMERLDMKPGLAVACARAVALDPQCDAGGLAS